MIRLFRNSDLNSLQRLIYVTIGVSYSNVYPDLAVQYFKGYHSARKILERNRKGIVMVGESADDIVATGSLVGNEILGVFVHPDIQGQGCGKRVMRELESRAKAQDLSEVVLSVSLPSRKFYEKLEYEILSECTIDVGEGQHLTYWAGRKILF